VIIARVDSAYCEGTFVRSGATFCRFSRVPVGKKILISANSKKIPSVPSYKKLVSVDLGGLVPPGVCNGFYETLPA